MHIFLCMISLLQHEPFAADQFINSQIFHIPDQINLQIKYLRSPREEGGWSVCIFLKENGIGKKIAE